VRRYSTVKALSRVANELLRRAPGGREEVVELLHAPKHAYVAAGDVERFRRELGRRLEDR